MKGIQLIYLLFLAVILASCSNLSNGKVEEILTNEKAYPLVVEYRMFRNSDQHVQEVIDKKLVENGFLTAQLKHSKEDLGQPLIFFTEKSNPYLIATNDTLKSFDIQRIKVAEEVFVKVTNIEINPAGDKAVVDYTTKIINPTPFMVLYNQDVEGEQKRRTFFTRKEDKWTWDGKIMKMLN